MWEIFENYIFIAICIPYFPHCALQLFSKLTSLSVYQSSCCDSMAIHLVQLLVTLAEDQPWMIAIGTVSHRGQSLRYLVSLEIATGDQLQ